MKDNKLKICIAILLIIILILISFFGVYKKDKGIYTNIVKDFNYSMDMSEVKIVTLDVSDETYEQSKDKDGNIVDDVSSLTDEEKQEQGIETLDVPYNDDNVKTLENYNISKKILEKRLEDMGFDDYNVRINDETGTINIELKNNQNLNQDIGSILAQGVFEIKDEQTGEVLLDNSMIKDVNAKYTTQSTGLTSTQVITYLDFEFTKEGKQKLNEISTIYVPIEENEEEEEVEDEEQEQEEVEEEVVEEEEEEETQEEKQIGIYIDGNQMLTTTFDQEIVDGTLQLTYGQATDSSEIEDIQSNLTNAKKSATLIGNGALPIKYSVSDNINIQTQTTKESLKTLAICILAIILVGLGIYIVKYKTNGILASIGFIGYIALYILVLRYTNTVISIAGLFAIIAGLVINYVFTYTYLKNVSNFKVKIKSKLKEEENGLLAITMLKNLILLIPTLIICITLIFANKISIISFGTIMFWAIALSYIFNFAICFQMVKLNNEDKLNGGNNE